MSASAEVVAIIGGGVSGIAAAHYLLEAGFKVDLYEASTQLGGRVCIDTLGEREVCFGGKNIGYQYDEFRTFIESYAAPQYEYFGINSARLVRGNIKTFNSKSKVKSLFNLLDVASVKDLLKLKKAMAAVKGNRQNGDLIGPYFQTLIADKHSTIDSYFGPKFTASIIRSLTVRMNGAEPSQVSFENLGTHLQMLGDEYDQLSSPLSDVLQSFQTRTDLNVYLNSWVESLSSQHEKFILRIGDKSQHYENIVLALPADAASKLLRSHWQNLSSNLGQVRYFPVGMIVAEYEDPVFTPDVRALTFGADSPLSNIGAYGANDLHLVRYTFSGEAAHEVLHETLNERDLLNMAEAIANPYFNIADNSCRHFKMKYWPSGLCGYTLSEAQFQANLTKDLSRHSGLFLTGDYIKGASIENCFRAAKATVKTFIQTHSNTTQPKNNPANFKEVANV